MNVMFAKMRYNQLTAYRARVADKLSTLEGKYETAQEYYENEWGDPWKCGEIMGKLAPDIDFLKARLRKIDAELNSLRKGLKQAGAL